MAPYPNAISGLPEGGMLFFEVMKHGAKLEGTVANLKRGAIFRDLIYVNIEKKNLHCFAVIGSSGMATFSIHTHRYTHTRTHTPVPRAL